MGLQRWESLSYLRLDPEEREATLKKLFNRVKAIDSQYDKDHRSFLIIKSGDQKWIRKVIHANPTPRWRRVGEALIESGFQPQPEDYEVIWGMLKVSSLVRKNPDFERWAIEKLIAEKQWKVLLKEFDNHLTEILERMSTVATSHELWLYATESVLRLWLEEDEPVKKEAFQICYHVVRNLEVVSPQIFNTLLKCADYAQDQQWQAELLTWFFRKNHGKEMQDINIHLLAKMVCLPENQPYQERIFMALLASAERHQCSTSLKCAQEIAEALGDEEFLARCAKLTPRAKHWGPPSKFPRIILY